MSEAGFLHRYFLNNGGKRIHKWMHYFDIYEQHFHRFRGAAPTVLEIGVFGGGSLAMWRAYFGPGATILGLDIDPACKQHETEGVTIHIGSQDDPAVLDRIVAQNRPIDIVIDDGSHRMDHMRRSFDLLYERIAERGVYLVEDTHTCYWPEYQGGYRAPGSFMEFAKDKLDEINAVHTRGAVAITPFTRSTRSVTIYDSVCVFERAPQGRRQAPITEPMPASE
ncbi:class I SAM-dependent methyltransferase [Consotaella aegiceratis]|uniref:class I SAM-dependent methyltransferase n=1 Tax=Consotaella aegiceratis TaxID=3097961 RepID=UPI002F3E35FE